MPLTHKMDGETNGKKQSDRLALATEIVSDPLMIRTIVTHEEVRS